MPLKKRRKTSQGRPIVEKVIILLLLALAWTWIGAAFFIVWRGMMSSVAPSNTNTVISNAQQQQQVGGETPLIIFTCKRAEYLRKTLENVIEYLPQDCRIGCPLIISQDGHDVSVETTIKEFQQSYPKIPILHYQHAPQLRKQPYKELAIHYKWAIGKVYQEMPQAQRIIILEEDLQVSVDFFLYFEQLAPLLDVDESLLAISAFNDNGFGGKVKDASRVLRSDFFPGLGWMMTRKLWESELKSKWPDGYWDDWLREPPQRKERQVLRPEISRTFHFGTKGGASSNQFGSLLSSVSLNTERVDWNSVDIDYLRDEHQYHAKYMEMVENAHSSTSLQDALQACKTANVKLEYISIAHFAILAKQLHIMGDEKAGVPRTAYKGIVETRPHGNHLLFLVPKEKW